MALRLYVSHIGVSMTVSRLLLMACLLSSVLVTGAISDDLRKIDTAHSRVIVRVSKAGLLSAFGDNHEIEAPISEGFVDEKGQRVRFVIESRQMRVLDPQLSPDKRQQVQDRMLGPDVLDVPEFPQILFESTAVQLRSTDQMLVRGQLTLHGQTHPVLVRVQGHNGEYRGTCNLKQRDFGITPVSVAGGTVKVKDELTIEFDIRTTATVAGVHQP